MTDRRVKLEGVTLSGVALVAGVPNVNGILYPPEVAKKLAEDMAGSHRYLFAKVENAGSFR